jgi:phage terminase small subunit
VNAKHARFVAEYRKDLNATQAAIRAGYSQKTARQQASDLLAKPDIQAAVAEKTAAALEKAELTADRVLEELRRLAFADIRGLFDERGNLRPLHELSAEQAAAVASFEVVKQNIYADDGKVDTVHKLKVYDKTKALDMLAKHFGLLTEKIEHSGAIALRWQND